MFIVSKDGFSIMEPKQVCARIEYSEEVKAEAQRIYDKVIRDNVGYGFRVSSEIEDFANKKVNEYAKGKGVCSIILDREINFGDYDEVQGKAVFEEILRALRDGERFFDMREMVFDD